MKLFDFQTAAVNELHELFKKHREVCLAWYTGAGKTNVFCEYARQVIEANPKARIGISAYMTREIKFQVGERLELFGLGHHTQVVGREPLDSTANILVFNPQAVYRREKLPLDVLIIDEGHVGTEQQCKMLNILLNEWCGPNTKILLVSATPWDTLASKRFQNAPVLKRPLDQGIKDQLITDFKFHAEVAQIRFTEEDFTRSGDLGQSAAERQMALLKSACMGKMQYLIDNYGKELGKKVLVICPPGNASEVARTMAKEIPNSLAFLQSSRTRGTENWENTSTNLETFKTDPSVRFLFVVNKCQVGFDMKDLGSVVDMTMTRNIKVLAQRCGRIARKNGAQKKNYFYVCDESLTREKLDWLVFTMIDFALGAYEGWTTRTSKYRRMDRLPSASYLYPYSRTLSEIVQTLRQPPMIQNERSVSFVQGSPPTKWNLPMASAQARTFANRTELWSKQPSLYKWFRLNAKAELDLIFPLRKQHAYWNEERVIEAMKQVKSRSEFHTRFGSADDWCQTHGRTDLRDKYLPPSKSTKKWTHDTIVELLKRLRSWSHVRSYRGARRWMYADGGGEAKYRKLWHEIHNKEIKPYSRKGA